MFLSIMIKMFGQECFFLNFLFITYMSIEKRFDTAINILISDGHFSKQSDFAKAIGEDASGLTSLKRGVKRLRIDHIQKLKESLPQFNSEWLLTGQGEVYLSAESPNFSLNLTENHFEKLALRLIADGFFRNKAEIAEAIGEKTLTPILSGNKRVRADHLQKLKLAVPSFNVNSYLTGEGDVYLSGVAPSMVAEPQGTYVAGQPEVSTLLQQLVASPDVAEQERLAAAVRREIDQLIAARDEWQEKYTTKMEEMIAWAREVQVLKVRARKTTKMKFANPENRFKALVSRLIADGYFKNKGHLADVLGEAFLTDLINGKKRVRADHLQKIKEQVPEFNSNWYLTDEGDMYLSVVAPN